MCPQWMSEICTRVSFVGSSLKRPRCVRMIGAHPGSVATGRTMEGTYKFAKAILKPWLASWFRWTIEGVENIPRQGPALLAINHIAYLDPLAACYVVDKRKRIPRFLAKQELFKDKKIAWVLRGTKQIPVHRGSADAPMALDAAIEAVHRGELIVIFP